MKTVSIRELHATTGEFVRSVMAEGESILITDHGKPAAILKAATAAEFQGKPFPEDHWRKVKRPKVDHDSTGFISEDRNR